MNTNYHNYVARLISKFSPDNGDAKRELTESFINRFSKAKKFTDFNAGDFARKCYTETVLRIPKIN